MPDVELYEAPFLAPLMLLADRLRRARIPVTASETADAVRVMANLDPLQRDILRAGLGAVFIKRAEYLPVFRELFDQCFPPRPELLPAALRPPSNGSPDADSDSFGVNGSLEFEWVVSDRGGESRERAPQSAGELIAALLEAIRSGNEDLLRSLAGQAIDDFAILGTGASTEQQYLQRVTRALDLANLMQRAMRNAREDAAGDRFDEQLRRVEAAELVGRLRELLALEVRARMAALSPADTITTVKYPDDVIFDSASNRELQELRRAVRPLARKLAARLAARRKRRVRGRLDVRRTVRRSLATGGVPLDPVHRSRRPARSDIVLLCDVSGSVAEFAAFTISLVHALHGEFPRLRTFVFVDGVAEVSALFDDAPHNLGPHGLLSQSGVVVGDGHSDYGAVFDRFLNEHRSVISAHTTLIVTGDARSNYRDPRSSAFDRIAGLARHTYWLNPEPEASWGIDDSAMADYRLFCDAAYEVRNLRQLGSAVLAIDTATR